MPIAVQDYRTSRVRLRSVTSSDPTLRALYLELLFALWERGGRIPADPDSVADEVGLPASDVAPRLAVLVNLGKGGRGGIVIEDGWIKNARVSEDLEHALAYRERQSYRGRRSGAVRRERGLSAGSASAEPSSSVPVSDPSPDPVTVPAVPGNRRGHQPPREQKDLGAYYDAMQELWPESPIPREYAVHRALQSSAATLPPLEEFRANIRAWLTSDRMKEIRWSQPEWCIRDGAFNNPPPTKRTVRSKPTVEDVRHQLIDWIFDQGLEQSILDSLVERAKVAATIQELRVIEEEAGRARVA